MQIKLLFNAIVSRTRVQCLETASSYPPGATLRCYTMKGGRAKLWDGSLWTDSYETEEAVIQRAVERIREWYPKARIIVTMCEVCQVHAAPGRTCRHV